MTSTSVVSPLRLPSAWWVWLVGGGALVLGYHWAPVGLAQSAVYVGVGVLGLAAMALGIRLRRPVTRAPWLLLLLSQALSVLGDLVGAVDASRGGAERFPTAADACYLAAYPALGAALVLLTRGRRPPRDLQGLLDFLAMLVGLVLVMLVLVGRLRPAANGSPLAVAVASAYPQLDILVVALLVALITTPGARTPALQLLVVALGLVMVADVGATALDQMTYDSTGVLDHLWLASDVLLGAALLHPSLHELSVPVPPEQGQLGRSRIVASILATLLPPGVLVAEHLLHRPISVWPIALASAAMFLLVVARMTLVIRQIGAVQAEREQAQEALAHQASHDSLTGLPNRAHALELIGDSKARAERSGAQVALLFVDLDGFKTVNDSYGHRAGDEVLQAVAIRMRAAVRQDDLVGRLGGDEFVVLLEPPVATESAVAVADRLVAEVSTPVVTSQSQRVRVGASVGVVVSQDATANAEALLNEADIAAYRAKRLGRGRVEVFDETLRRELQERADVERGLRRAIEEDLLVVEYEPVVVLSTGREQGFETRVSWDRPGSGRVSIQEFGPVAELSDLVFDLDTWVMRSATSQLARWNTLGGPRLRIGVDLSARHLARARVLEDVRQAVEDAGIDPSQLVVEITDRTFIDDPVGFSNLDRIRQLGVQVGLEDFGTGYSSVRRLQRLPIDLVKLDVGFVDWRSPSGFGLLRLMAQGVQNFGLPLVVTGVQDAEHRDAMAAMGCEVMQGPCFGEPLTGDEVAERIARQQVLTS